MMPRFLLLLAAALALSLSGCVSNAELPSPTGVAPGSVSTVDASVAPRSVDVSLSGLAFINDTVTIRVGDTIVWTHRDDQLTSHAIMTNDGTPESFASHPACMPPGVPAKAVCMTSGDTYAHVFTKPGQYGIHCHVHMGMKMIVTVLPSPGAASA